MFVNRRHELRKLREKLNEKGNKLIIIFGRRRVGKTELAIKISREFKSIYYLCETTNTKENAIGFSKAAAEVFQDIPPHVENFKDVFRYIKKRDENILVILDEFTYLVKNNRNILSEFQKINDVILRGTNIKLIIIGSIVSVMKEDVLSEKSPLYGRRDLNIFLNPLRFKYIHEFFPDYKIEDQIRTYGTLDGIPFYLSKFSNKLGFWENIERKILDPTEVLYMEVPFLLKSEFRETRTYFLTLKALTKTTNLAEAANFVGKSASDLKNFMSNLIGSELVKKEQPILKTKHRPQYKIKDNFTHFWFEFVQPSVSKIEAGLTDKVLKDIKLKFSTYMGPKFEQVCTQAVQEQVRNGIWDYGEIGRQWGKLSGAKRGEQYEFDILALNKEKKKALVGECKWQENIDAKKVVSHLQETVDYVKELEDYKVEYAVFAQSFKQREEGARCFDLRELERVFQTN